MSTLQVLALVATIAAPLVASAVFVATVIYDRAHRRHEDIGRVVAKALASATTAGKWSMWPYPVAMLGTWQLDVITDTAAVAIQLPKRRYRSLGPWLMEGATRVGMDPNSARRISAISNLVAMLVIMQNPSREALREAHERAVANPWPEVDISAPRHYQVLRAIGVWPLRFATGDLSYGRRTAER